MEKICKKLLILAAFLLLFVIFLPWFNTSGLISAGDFWPVFSYSSYHLFPFAWNNMWGTGLGGFISPVVWHYFTASFPIKLWGDVLGLEWIIVERLGFLFPILILAFLSAFVFSSAILKRFSLLTFLILSLNTYVLMVIGGGQIFISLSYFWAPFVLLSFIKLIENRSIKFSFVSSLAFGVQLLLDPRIAYVTMVGVGLYWIVNLVFIRERNAKNIFSSLVFSFVIPGALAFLLHAFWLLPTILYGANPIEGLGAAYSTGEAVKFFSFAKFEQTISLLHPYWPENIFGKVGFMKPEFLILPILAYSSLLFVNSKSKIQNSKISPPRRDPDWKLSAGQFKNQKSSNSLSIEQPSIIMFFALLGLLGAFLAKGSNEPFGFVYLWLFEYLPGFNLFRDPMKWYTLVALSYSILIPFSVWNILKLLKSKVKCQLSIVQHQRFLPNLFLLAVVLYLLFLIRPAVFGQLGGTFRATQIPQDYTRLEEFLSKDEDFYRTFWVPAVQRFSLSSQNHPAISGRDFINDYDLYAVSEFLGSEAARETLENASVKYVIVPFDSEGEIFLDDREYDQKQYRKTISDLEKIPWLQRVAGFERVAVFRVPLPKDHFYIESDHHPQAQVSYEFINPTKYKLRLKNVREGDRLVFSEGFDRYWEAYPEADDKSKISSQKYDRYNSFPLSREGDYNLTVHYKPQDWVHAGLGISGVSLVAVLALLFFGLRREYAKISIESRK